MLYLRWTLWCGCTAAAAGPFYPGLPMGSQSTSANPPYTPPLRNILLPDSPSDVIKDSQTQPLLLGTDLVTNGSRILDVDPNPHQEVKRLTSLSREHQGVYTQCTRGNDEHCQFIRTLFARLPQITWVEVRFCETRARAQRNACQCSGAHRKTADWCGAR